LKLEIFGSSPGRQLLSQAISTSEIGEKSGSIPSRIGLKPLFFQMVLLAWSTLLTNLLPSRKKVSQA
jgi:hypothetical protein